MLHVDEQLAHAAGQRLAQQQADVRVELVHIAHGRDAQVVLGHARVVAQAGAAVVAGARGDLCESFAHGVWWCLDLPGLGLAQRISPGGSRPTRFFYAAHPNVGAGNSRQKCWIVGALLQCNEGLFHFGKG